jgi:hypothetical protein
VSASGEDAVREAVARLEALAEDLEVRGFAARLVDVGGYAAVKVKHRVVSQLSETVYAAPAVGGAWWFWWSWADPIAPLSEVHAAAFKITYVLTPSGR